MSHAHARSRTHAHACTHTHTHARTHTHFWWPTGNYDLPHDMVSIRKYSFYYYYYYYYIVSNHNESNCQHIHDNVKVYLLLITLYNKYMYIFIAIESTGGKVVPVTAHLFLFLQLSIWTSNEKTLQRQEQFQLLQGKTSFYTALCPAFSTAQGFYTSAQGVYISAQGVYTSVQGVYTSAQGVYISALTELFNQTHLNLSCKYSATLQLLQEDYLYTNIYQCIYFGSHSCSWVN